MTITSGEWKVFENPDGLGEDKGSITIEADGVVIARVNSHIPEAMANARLMVASKEMYEALKAILIVCLYMAERRRRNEDVLRGTDRAGDIG